MFQSFQLTYHARTTFIDIYGHSSGLFHIASNMVRALPNYHKTHPMIQSTDWLSMEHQRKCQTTNMQYISTNSTIHTTRQMTGFHSTYNNGRNEHFQIFNVSNYKVGRNLMVNRFLPLNNKIDYSWLNGSFESYKIKCKNLLL